MEDAEVRRILENAAYEMATLYYHMARRFIEAYGERATEVIREAIRDWGTEKGTRHRSNVQSMGLATGLDNLDKGSTLPWGPIMDSDQQLSAGELRITTRRCPLADVWRGHDAFDLARLYCDEVDTAKWKAYNSDITAERPRVMTHGDDVCEFVLRLHRG